MTINIHTTVSLQVNAPDNSDPEEVAQIVLQECEYLFQYNKDDIRIKDHVIIDHKVQETSYA